MGIRLDAPPAPTEIPQDQAINVLRLVVPHEADENGAMKIVKEQVRLIAHITTYNEDGRQMAEASMSIPLDEVPGAGVNLLKQLYSWLESEAGTRGFMGAGVAEDLDAPVVP